MNQLIKADIVLRNFAHRGFVSFKGKASELYLGRRQKQTEIYTLHLRKNKYIVKKKKYSVSISLYVKQTHFTY